MSNFTKKEPTMNNAPETSWTAKIKFPDTLVCKEDRGFMRMLLAGFGTLIVAFVPPLEVKAVMGGTVLFILFILSLIEFLSERRARLRQLEYTDVVPRGKYKEVEVEGVPYRTSDDQTWYSSEGEILKWDLADKLKKIVATQKVWPDA